MAPKVVLSAGETSGDINGAALARELKKIIPGVSLAGAGGFAMKEAGVDLRVFTEGLSTIGVAEALKVLPKTLRLYHKMRRLLSEETPDLFVPIDAGAFNVRLARLAKEKGAKVIYYFPPSSWRKHLKNPAMLAPVVDHVITPFPWSRDILRSGGIDARFLGHPLLDTAVPTLTKSEFKRKYGFDESKKLVGILPGSRGHEIKCHTTEMLKAAEIVNREVPAEFVVCLGPKGTLAETEVAKFTKTHPYLAVKCVRGETYNAMAASDYLFACSGTATLEAAIIGTPMVIVYGGTAVMLIERVFRPRAVERFIGMPNIIAEKEICPELLGKDVTAENMAECCLRLFRNKDGYEETKEALRGVRGVLGEPGAVRQSAEIIAELGGFKVSN